MMRLAWNSQLRPAVIPPDGLVLLGENQHYLFRGAAYARAAPLLDGRSSDEEIHATLVGDGLSSVSVWLALSHLRALGVVSEMLDDPDGNGIEQETVLLKSPQKTAGAVAGRSQLASVAVRCVGGTGATALEIALRSAGVPLVADLEPEGLLLVVADNYLDPQLDVLNRSALENGCAWMLVRLAGTVPWIGPLLVPGKTGCWRCLAQRLRLNRQTEELIAQRLGSFARAPLPAIDASLRLAAEFAVVQAKRWLAAREQADAVGRLLALDLKTNGLVRHTLVRRPQCTACGELQSGRGRKPSKANAVALLSSPKISAGGRSESAERTIARYAHHVSPLTGVVRALFESQDHCYLHVAASQTFPMHRYDFRVLRDNLLGRSGGKGFDAAQARVSALCEALERYSGIWQGEEEEVVSTTWRELGDEAINPVTLFGFSTRQYAERDAWNAANDEPHAWVPKQLQDDLTIDWVPCRSLIGARTKLVPAAYCYYGHPDLRHTFCSSDSNGCAAGGTLTEAVAHGLLELIERDAAAVWWYNKTIRPEINLDTFGLPFLDELRALYRGHGRTFWALDLTTDLGIPVVAAISARLDAPGEDIIYGFGSDFDPSVAVAKALLETNQSLFAVFKAVPGGSVIYRTDRPAVRRWFKSATRANQSYLVPDPDRPPISRSQFDWCARDNWRDDVLQCAQRLQDAGHEVFILDLTRPDVRLPVTRVIVPGLCHFWRRFGTPRLYQVPVRMSWRQVASDESELNPWLIYF
jgi:ribosomal protein S12 methylthiotransferase accessory factor